VRDLDPDAGTDPLLGLLLGADGVLLALSALALSLGTWLPD